MTTAQKDAKEKAITDKNLPQGWVECELKAIAVVKGGKRLPAGAKYADNKTEFSYIRVTNFDNMTVDVNDIKYLTPEIQIKIKNYIISKDDVYISIAGSIGKVGIIPDSLHNANLTENAAKIVHNINKKYLAYYLNSTSVQHQIISFTKSTTQPKLALYRIEELDIKLPPLPEQARIVEKIEELFSNIDAGIEKLEQAKLQIKQYKQSVLKSFLRTKGLKYLLSDIGCLHCGQSLSAEDVNTNGEGIVYITGPEQWNNGKLHFNKWTLKPKKIAPEQCIFITVKGAGVGKTCVGTKACIGRDVYAFEPTIVCDFNFIHLQIVNTINEVVLKAQGLIPGLTKIDILEHPVFIPDIEEQQKIVEEIEKRFEVAAILEKAVIEGLEKSKQLKQSILKKAFEGKLIPQDPNDEPASVLLEGIKAENTKSKGKK